MGSSIEASGWTYGNSMIQHWFVAGAATSLCRRGYNGIDIRALEPQNPCSTCISMLRKHLRDEPSTKRTPR